MEATTGPYLAAIALLAVGGAPKLWSPADTSRALRALGAPVNGLAVRVIGAAELLTAAGALLLPGRDTALAVAAWYAVFAVVVWVALRRRAPLASCGCFGAAESPPSHGHLVLVIAAGASAAAVAWSPPVALLAGSPAHGIPLLAFAAVAAWFGYLVMTGLPALSHSVRTRA